MWHERRFTQSAGKIEVGCEICSRPMFLPPSKAAKYTTCSDACRAERTARWKQERTRLCETCGGAFIPRVAQVRAGQGRYCTRRCIPSDHLTTEDNLRRAADGFREAIRSGRWQPLRGEANANWRGGYEAMIRRQTASGRPAAYIRAWRRANPDKVKEQAQRRRSGVRLLRLPYGTVPRIRKAQRDRCAICRVPLRGKGHLDHIEPITRGGAHEPRNLQLLCAPCNLRKNGKDPFVYMRQIGKLL